MKPALTTRSNRWVTACFAGSVRASGSAFRPFRVHRELRGSGVHRAPEPSGSSSSNACALPPWTSCTPSTPTDCSCDARRSSTATATVTCTAHAPRAGSPTYRHGAYVSAPTWIAADDLERHKLACQAVLLTHGHRVALSHTSAAVMHGLRLWQPDLSHVHVIRLDGQSGRRHAGVVYHRDDWQAELIYNLDEMLLLDPITSALGAASLTAIEAGLTVVDSLFDLDLGSPDDVAAAYSATRPLARFPAPPDRRPAGAPRSAVRRREPHSLPVLGPPRARSPSCSTRVLDEYGHADRDHATSPGPSAGCSASSTDKIKFGRAAAARAEPHRRGRRGEAARGRHPRGDRLRHDPLRHADLYRPRYPPPLAPNASCSSRFAA